MEISFTKYQGLGNDFILIDNRNAAAPLLTPEHAVQLCDRNFGIGADGIIFLLRDGAGYRMRIFNADGSEPEMCGNGIRCLAKFMQDLEITPKIGVDYPLPYYRIQTGAGEIVPQLGDGQIAVDMGEPHLLAAEIPTTLVAPDSKAIAVPLEVDGTTWTVTTVSMGNPHCITFVPDTDRIPLAAIGPQFEHHAAFPQRTNTEFTEVVRRDYIKMRVWERGAGATLACGTGACAAVVAAVLNNLCGRTCTVQLPGGELHIQWSAETNRILMTGPARAVFTGQAQC